MTLSPRSIALLGAGTQARVYAMLGLWGEVDAPPSVISQPPLINTVFAKIGGGGRNIVINQSANKMTTRYA